MDNNFGPDPPQSQPSATDEHALQTETESSSALDQKPIGVKGDVIMVRNAKRRIPWRRIVVLSLLILGLVAGTLVAVYASKRQTIRDAASADPSSRIKSQVITLSSLSQRLDTASSQTTARLTVNGQIVVSNSLVLQPSAQPTNALAGQIYYDESSNNLAYFDGTQFVEVQGGNTQITNSPVTNIINGAGGVSGEGTPGSIALFTSSNHLGDSLLSQSGSTVNIASNFVNIGNSATNHNIQIGTGAGVQTVALGSGQAGSATTIQGGTGNLSLTTGATFGVSGSIAITTGNSSTTSSGNITIDTGSSIISGEMVENKTFEGSLDAMGSWFGNTVAQSSAQAHSGIYSLAETGTGAFWGVIETLPGTSVIAGHQYYFSIWVRAATTPRSITATAVWVGALGTVPLTTVTDSTTGWTEMTGLGIAPGGATSVYLQISSIGTVGEVHYFDDITITDLSSSAAASVISIGSANAKIITIGNINQIGPTSIFGGSGINLNSSAAGITLTGGTIGITGSAASSLSTTSGALTITSAASATWSVAPASLGNGGDLTVRAGNGGIGGNNNGGNIMLQGGRPEGTGLAGSVIVKGQIDSTGVFQIQNSAGTPFLIADSAAMRITVGGTNSNYADFTLANAHFGSTQTTAPTISTPANCGTAPAAAILGGSTDSAGSFTITTGTGSTASTCDSTITFNQTYSAAPKSVLVVGKTDAASAARQVFVSSATPTGFTISFAASAAGANSTAYSFSYWVIE